MRRRRAGRCDSRGRTSALHIRPYVHACAGLSRTLALLKKIDAAKGPRITPPILFGSSYDEGCLKLSGTLVIRCLLPIMG